MTNNNDSDQHLSAINISRPVLSDQNLKSRYGYEPSNELPMKNKVLKALTPKEKSVAKFVKNFVTEKIPITRWLPKYKVKKWLLADVISGLTIGVMQIPQGIGNFLIPKHIYAIERMRRIPLRRALTKVICDITRCLRCHYRDERFESNTRIDSGIICFEPIRIVKNLISGLSNCL